MKIKIVKFPYKEFQVGEVIDLGEEKNRSMVNLQRAVWVGENNSKPKKAKKDNVEVTEVIVEKEDVEIKESEATKKIVKSKKKKKLIGNQLKEKITEKTDGKDESFWDKLK
jgi:hypothetical protein